MRELLFVVKARKDTAGGEFVSSCLWCVRGERAWKQTVNIRKSRKVLQLLRSHDTNVYIRRVVSRKAGSECHSCMSSLLLLNHTAARTATIDDGVVEPGELWCPYSHVFRMTEPDA